MGKTGIECIKLKMAMNNITPKCVTTMEPFYYVNQLKIITIEVGTTWISKASKPPMNTYVKYEMMLHSRIPKNKYNAILDGKLLLEM